MTESNYRTPHIYGIALLVLTLFLTACNRFDNTNDSTETTSGNAVKGLIAGGIVNIYEIENGIETFIDTTRTDSEGNFTTAYAPNNKKIGLLELTTDNLTYMICDVFSGCVESDSGALIPFGDQVSLPAHFKLSGIIIRDTDTQKSQAYLSPLSHIITSMAKQLPNGLTQENIEIASNQLSSVFGLDSQPLHIKTPDITSLDTLQGLSEQQLYQGILGAALYSQSLSLDWAEGNINLDSFSLTDIFLQTSELASQLSTQQESINSPYTPTLSSISSAASENHINLSSANLIILLEPNSVIVNEGDSISLYVQANGEGTLHYQWQKDNQDIPNTNTSSLNISPATVEHSGIYRVIISNEAGSISSLQARVTVSEVISGVTITKGPNSQNVVEGDTATFSVEVSGDGPFDYQWQKEGSVIPGANQSTLTIDNINKSDEGSYRVTVSNSNSEQSSNFINLWVSTSISSVVINKQPQNKVINEGDSVSFSVVASAGGFISYQWIKSGIPINNAYTATYTIDSTSLNDAGLYEVIVTNSQGSISSESATLVVIQQGVPVSIIQQPRSQSVTEGSNASLTVQALGDGPIAYQWLLNGSEITNANQATYSIESAASFNGGIYSVSVSNANSTELSLSALLSVEKQLSSVLITWSRPTEREDESELLIGEISSYHIQYGYSADNLSESATVSDPSSLSQTLSKIDSSVLYFRIATIDDNNQQGRYSDITSITIP